MDGTAKRWIAMLAAVAATACAACAGGLQRGRDGQDDVRRASFLGRDGKWDEGRAFVNSLRSRPQKGLSPEERQSADMAEFALLRNDLPKNKARCIECLKAAYSAAPGSFWGWAAWTFLGDLGVKVPEPAKDPLREGLFATAVEDDPWVVVELAGDVRIAGVTLSGDCTGLKLWTSVDGNKWIEAASSGGGAEGWRVDLRASQPQAKYVKAGRPGGGKPLKLRKVLVYGNRLF